MGRIKLFFTLFLFTGIYTITQAQVTIGSDELPLSGALLQLKQTGTTTKGLGMSRVKITDKDNLFPMFVSGSPEYSGANKTVQDAGHIGLIVYNTYEDFCAADPIFKGLHVWTGKRWQTLREERPSNGTYEFTDARDNEVYLARNFGATAGDWMLENLRYDPVLYPHPSFTNFTHTAAISFSFKYFIYAEGGGGTYNPAIHPSAGWPAIKKNGIMYNWYSATNGQNSSTAQQGQADAVGTDPTPRIQGICPAGWHLPSDKEWNDLEKETYENAQKYSNLPAGFGTWDADWSYEPFAGQDFRPHGATEAHGSVMKSPCIPASSAFPTKGNSLASIQGGLDMLLLGDAYNGKINNYGSLGFFWASSSYDTNYVWNRGVRKEDPLVYRAANFRGFFFNVRCKKD